MSLEHAAANSTIDPAAPATLISRSSPSPIHTSHASQVFSQRNPPPTSAPSIESLSSPSLAAHTERIPKLSATTTEILARVNGNIKDTIQGLGTTEYPNPGNNESNTVETSNTDARADMMKPAPSTTTVTFPATHMAEPAKMSTSSLKFESILPDSSHNIQNGAKKGTGKGVTPKPIQPKATPLQTAAATPSTSNSTSSTAKRQMNATRRGNGGAKRGKKRKRGNKHDDDSDSNGNGSSSDEATPSATQTKSGRQIHRPSFLAPVPKESTPTPDVQQAAQPTRKRRRVYRKGKEIHVTCTHCQRGHSPTNNMIVFCDECNGAWHQFCHDPPIGSEVIQVKEAEWFCRECKPVSNGTDNPAGPVASYPDVKPAEKIKKVIGVPFATKVGGEQYSEAEKHAHLSRLSHTALVNLLMDISASHPSLPIFPSNLSQTHIPSYTTPAETAISTPTTSMTTNASTTTTSFTSTAPTSAKSANNTPPIFISGPSLNREAESEDDDYEDVEEHRLYPKPGNGFLLPPESEDLDMLLEDPMCPTFSHSLHGPAKARAEASGMVGVSSMA